MSEYIKLLGINKSGEGLTWSDECPDCDQEMMLTRSGEFYRCEDCDKDYHETELFTF